MERAFITRWNLHVKPGDTVYHLGDFVFGGRKDLARIVNQLNGTIRLIRGNHDKVLKSLEAQKHFEWIKDYHELRGPDKVKIVLSHYAFEVWNKSHHGSWHLHGHSHGTLGFKDIKRLDVGVDSNTFCPVSMDEVAEIMKKRGYDAPDNHGKRSSR